MSMQGLPKQKILWRKKANEIDGCTMKMVVGILYTMRCKILASPRFEPIYFRTLLQEFFGSFPKTIV